MSAPCFKIVLTSSKQFLKELRWTGDFISKQFTKPRISDVYCKIILLVVVLLAICDRVCRPALQIRTLFQTKIKDVIFHTQTWSLKFNNPIQT